MAEMVAEIAALKEQNIALREQVKSSNKRIDTLEESVKILPKMETLLEINIETNKKQTDTLNVINVNLTNLNNSYESITHRVGAIEEDNKNSRKDSSININKIATDTITKIIPSILGGLILAWLYIQFGMK